MAKFPTIAVTLIHNDWLYHVTLIIFKKYNINLQIEHRVNIGGVHIYKEENINNDFDFSKNISIILCQMTNVFNKNKYEKPDEEYCEIKRDFFTLTNKLKEYKKTFI